MSSLLFGLKARGLIQNTEFHCPSGPTFTPTSAIRKAFRTRWPDSSMYRTITRFGNPGPPYIEGMPLPLTRTSVRYKLHREKPAGAFSLAMSIVAFTSFAFSPFCSTAIQS